MRDVHLTAPRNVKDKSSTKIKTKQTEKKDLMLEKQ